LQAADVDRVAAFDVAAELVATEIRVGDTAEQVHRSTRVVAVVFIRRDAEEPRLPKLRPSIAREVEGVADGAAVDEVGDVAPVRVAGGEADKAVALITDTAVAARGEADGVVGEGVCVAVALVGARLAEGRGPGAPGAVTIAARCVARGGRGAEALIREA